MAIVDGMIDIANGRDEAVASMHECVERRLSNRELTR